MNHTWLCRLGFHRWREVRVRSLSKGPPMEEDWQCVRCKKLISDDLTPVPIVEVP